MRIYDFIRFEEMVYTLDVMAPIFSSLHSSNFPNVGMIHFLCLPCSGRPYTLLVAKNVVYRATKQLKYSHRNTKKSTSTWFGLTEQHDRGHLTPYKFLRPHNPRFRHQNFRFLHVHSRVLLLQPNLSFSSF